jgi:hypothetical protein
MLGCLSYRSPTLRFGTIRPRQALADYETQRIKQYALCIKKTVIWSQIRKYINKLTKWSRVLLGKLTVTQLAKKLRAFMESEVSLPGSQETAADPYPKVICILSTPCHSVPQKPILILSYLLRLPLPNALCPSRFPTKVLYAFLISSMSGTCPTKHIVTDLITRLITGEVCTLQSSS